MSQEEYRAKLAQWRKDHDRFGEQAAYADAKERMRKAYAAAMEADRLSAVQWLEAGVPGTPREYFFVSPTPGRSPIPINRIPLFDVKPKREPTEQDKALHRAIGAKPSDDKRMGAAHWMDEE